MKRSWVELLTAVIAAMGVSTLAVASLAGVLSHQVLAVVLVFGVIWAVFSRAFLLWRRSVAYGFLRAPLAKASRPHLFQAVGRGWFWTVVTVTAVVIFPRIGLHGFVAAIAVLGVVRVAAELLPPRQVGRGVTAVMAAAGLMLAFELGRTLLPGPAAEVVLEPPFTGEWIVLQGGSTALVSHHVAAYNQLYALDLLRLENGSVILDEDPPTNASWFSWERPLLAPVDGTVVVAQDGTEDTQGLNLVADKEAAAGNHVVIQTSSGHFVLLAHLRNGSLKVARGDSVSVGQEVALCGNSGNTTSPHLHLQVQSHADLWDPENRSVPFTFAGQTRALMRNDHVRGRLK